MKLYTIDAGFFKLDGGAMFGVIPKTIWSKKIPSDDLNLCSWAMRCLLIEDGQRLILIDTGMGDKQPQKWQNYYFRHGEGELVKSIRQAGFSANDVTDVVLSHLHFDHAGGAISWNSDKTNFRLTFPNATYWTHSEHWATATNPNPREAATFLNENILPIQESGNLNFLDKINQPLGANIDFLFADGHTEKMVMPVITYQDKKIVFAADTMPSHAHIRIPYVMGYDVRPLETMKEKATLLEKAANEKWIIYFDHDPFYDCATIEKVDGKFAATELGKLSDFM